MFVIKWEGFGPKDYLHFVDFHTDKVKWGPLTGAITFTSANNAEEYLVNPETKYRPWKNIANVVFLHPLNRSLLLNKEA